QTTTTESSSGLDTCRKLGTTDPKLYCKCLEMCIIFNPYDAKECQVEHDKVCTSKPPLETSTRRSRPTPQVTISKRQQTSPKHGHTQTRHQGPAVRSNTPQASIRSVVIIILVVVAVAIVLVVIVAIVYCRSQETTKSHKRSKKHAKSFQERDSVKAESKNDLMPRVPSKGVKQNRLTVDIQTGAASLMKVPTQQGTVVSFNSRAVNTR